MSKVGVSTVMAFALLTAAVRPVSAQAPSSEPTAPKLYDRLGGAYAIATCEGSV